MRRFKFILLLAAWALCACSGPANSGSSSAQTQGTATGVPRPSRGRLGAVALADLPAEARPVLHQIARGGPFRSVRDGVSFANREHVLPSAPRGRYREYTVPTPGSSDRGARRIVCAGPPRSTRECYYSADHYATFRRIQP